jgi:hypothetical protein
MRTVRTRRWLPLSVALLASVPGALVSQIPAEEGAPAAEGLPVVDGDAPVDLTHEVTAPRARAIRASQAIQVDGRLDESIWTAAPPITGFRQIEPNEGLPASQPTEVRIVYDDQAIYVGANLRDSGPITTILARRDASMSESDAFVVIFDSYHDHQTAYRFATTPSGMKSDQIVTSGRNDSSWDPVWDVATHVSEDGWSVEMRIPFSQLRFSPEDEQVWGLQLIRTIHRVQEESVFSFTPRLERGGVHRYGHLEGIRGIRTGQRLELLPYVTGSAEYLQPRQAPLGDLANPFQRGSSWASGMGLDLKYRVSSNLTLDATVNPDFGQVEVDPAVINLTAFETRYQERRPFFVEGADIFRFGEGGPRGSVGNQPEVLYSRRIGRAPQGVVPSSAVYSQAASVTPILGAAKLTGRVGDGWSVGLLEAVTGRESTRYVDAEGIEGRSVVEPMTNYLLARVRRDVRGGNTRFGAIVTAVNRDLSDDALSGRLHSAAYTGGIDLVHQWADRRWRFNASISPSYVTGDAAAIRRTQQASTRYLQRPDADHLELDPESTSLAGYYAMGMLEKEAGTWTGRLGLGRITPGYEVNDLGFQSASDRILFDTHIQYNQPRPGRIFRSWNLSSGPNGIWNHSGDYLLDNTPLDFRWQWMNYWGGNLRVAYSMATYNDRLTRGGPMGRDPARRHGNFSINSDSRKSYSVRASFGFGDDDGGSRDRSYGLNVSYTPRENVDIRVGPQLSRNYTVAQYITTLTDARAVDTFGRRYVFGGLDQTTFSVETRLNVTFTPALSLQMYAQPFLSNGRYDSIKELRAPRVFEFLTYGEDYGTLVRQDDGFYRVQPAGEGEASFLVRDPDFTVRSLRGNAVLRWEWRAGSTMYFVWQQRREDRLTGLEAGLADAGMGGWDLARDARELGGIRPDNIFAIKVTYWLNP